MRALKPRQLGYTSLTASGFQSWTQIWGNQHPLLASAGTSQTGCISKEIWRVWSPSAISSDLESVTHLSEFVLLCWGKKRKRNKCPLRVRWVWFKKKKSSEMFRMESELIHNHHPFLLTTKVDITANLRVTGQWNSHWYSNSFLAIKSLIT